MSVLSRRLILLIIPLLLALAACAEPGREARLVLLHVNDVYEISPNKQGKGGLAQLMTLLKAERARAKHHLTTLGGDLISPSVLSGLTKGAHMIELMNALELDVAGLGNHEFDFGLQTLQKRIAESKFTWLATNTLGESKQPIAGVKKMRLLKVGAFTIGLFSLLTTDVKSKTSGASGLILIPVKAAAARAVKDLKARGADVIVAITHLDMAEDRELARAIKGVNVILGGHDHVPDAVEEGGVLIIKAGTDAHYLAVVDLDMKKEEDGKVTARTQWRMITTSGVEADPKIAKIVNALEARLNERLGQPVGVTSVELDSRAQTVRAKASAMGALIADAMRDSVKADVALINGGGIRGGRVYGAGETLTRKDILSELPFSNVTVLVELAGADLLAALENGVSRVEHADGRFPHVSGMSVLYDPGLEKGARVLDVKIGGHPLDKGKTYRLATNAFLYEGGDGYKMLKNGKLIISAANGVLVSTVVIDYIAKNSPVAPAVEGRVVQK